MKNLLPRKSSKEHFSYGSRKATRFSHAVHSSRRLLTATLIALVFIIVKANAIGLIIFLSVLLFLGTALYLAFLLDRQEINGPDNDRPRPVKKPASKGCAAPPAVRRTVRNKRGESNADTQQTNVHIFTNRKSLRKIPDRSFVSNTLFSTSKDRPRHDILKTEQTAIVSILKAGNFILLPVSSDQADTGSEQKILKHRFGRIVSFLHFLFQFSFYSGLHLLTSGKAERQLLSAATLNSIVNISENRKLGFLQMKDRKEKRRQLRSLGPVCRKWPLLSDKIKKKRALIRGGKQQQTSAPSAWIAGNSMENQYQDVLRRIHSSMELLRIEGPDREYYIPDSHSPESKKLSDMICLN